jgi:ABC-type transport system involved in multi-copper enzyme maturation permease subunit
MALVAGLHAAGTVARERQQQTLDDLLTVPGRRRDILSAKWVGSLARVRGMALGALAFPLVAVVAEGISVAAVLPLILLAGAVVACAASFGLWLSVRSRSVQRATGLWLLLVGLWVGGTFLAAQAAYIEERTRYRVYSFPPERPAPLVWDRALNPLLAWSQLCFRYRDGNEARYYYPGDVEDGRVDALAEVWPSLLGVAVFGLLALALYWAAAWRFETEGRG